jgi:flagellar protein FlgJ
MEASMNVDTTPIYHDLQSLSALRQRASSDPNAAIEEVAEQFESLFLQMMLKSMRDATATLDGGLFDSKQMEHYQSMFDQQISLDLSTNGGMGMSEILVEQLGGNQPLVETAENPQPLVPFSRVHEDAKRQMLNLYATTPPDSVDPVAAANQSSHDLGVGVDAQWSPKTPEDFIRSIWPFAVDAAEQLGLDPVVLVAQSALETGWGKQLIPTNSGNSSFNLFGIKASGNWEGESAAVNSLEFRDGVAVKENSSFRVYESLGASFEDYVAFLKSNPRYQQALEKVGDSQQFLTELQDAGYATDPRYAEKIMAIVGQSSTGPVINELKKSQVLPLPS